MTIQCVCNAYLNMLIGLVPKQLPKQKIHEKKPINKTFAVFSGCLPGFYGANCTETCQCAKNATCNPKNGRCRCQPGWRGRRCDQSMIMIIIMITKFSMLFIHNGSCNALTLLVGLVKGL